MLKRLRDLVFRDLDAAAAPPARERALRLATAALLVEMSRADADESAHEHARIVALMERHFGLERAATEALLADASREADAAISLHEFTRLLNEALAPAEKYRVLELLWRVAFADARLDRYEDHLVRKIADLLYLPHADFIRAKLEAQAELGLAPG
jgi:uncharacterized tellurite resistance protein B-like protein